MISMIGSLQKARKGRTICSMRPHFQALGQWDGLEHSQEEQLPSYSAEELMPKRPNNWLVSKKDGIKI